MRRSAGIPAKLAVGLALATVAVLTMAPTLADSEIGTGTSGQLYTPAAPAGGTPTGPYTWLNPQYVNPYGSAPSSPDSCEPVACPAIAKLCPQGQIACHPSPCSCALACVPDQGRGCDF